MIRHYITFTSDLTITAPTVLIIEEGGTLCGDHLMNVSCGARVINYGHWYLNQLKMKLDGPSYNYNEFYFKNYSSFSGCGTPGSASFYNVPPNGHINTWAPELCKTAGTNWPKTTTGLLSNTSLEETLTLSPNPLNSGFLNISAKGDFTVKLYDTRSELLYDGSATDNTFIDMHEYANGFYFVSIVYKNKQISRKILVDQ